MPGQVWIGGDAFAFEVHQNATGRHDLPESEQGKVEVRGLIAGLARFGIVGVGHGVFSFLNRVQFRWAKKNQGGVPWFSVTSCGQINNDGSLDLK